MYYIIETNYVGPNQDQDRYVDVDRIEISAAPARNNQDYEICTEGWCGTTNDWAVYAHGEYATIEAARAAIAAKFGDVRDSSPQGDEFESDDPDVVATYKPGKYEPMTAEATDQWVSASDDIAADTSDERLAELAAEYESIANSEGYTLDSGLLDMLREYRQDLRDDD